MTRLNWEKQNRSEMAKEKRRESQRTKILKAYQNGAKRERDHILRILENNHLPNLGFPSHNAMGNCPACWTLDLIKGEQK